ncbi:MAG: hypothetical protein U0636_10225 [Phycisphaerales bacterium]
METPDQRPAQTAHSPSPAPAETLDSAGRPARMHLRMRRMVSRAPSVGMTLLGAGLLSLAAVEAGLLVKQEVSPATLPTEITQPTVAMGAHAPAALAAMPAAQDTPAVPGRGAAIVSIAADTTTTGVTVYRLWDTGRIEATVLGDANTWSDWTPVAPGLSGKSGKTKKPSE